MVEKYTSYLEKSIKSLGFSEELEKFVRKHLSKVYKAYGALLGLLLLPLFDSGSYQEFARRAGWGKNKPYRILGSASKGCWVRMLRRRGFELFLRIVREYHTKSAATKSRYKITFVCDDTTLLKFAKRLGLVGIWWSGNIKDVVLGVSVVVLYAVVGDGKLWIPLDFRIRRPDPEKAGRKCLTKPDLVEEMVEEFKDKCKKRRIDTDGWFTVLDAWYGSKDLLDTVTSGLRFTMVVEGKANYVFYVDDQRVHGKDLFELKGVRWHNSTQMPLLRYARVRARSPSFGPLLLLLWEKGEERRYLMMRDNFFSSVRIIVAFKLRWWVEDFFRTLKSHLKIESFQFTKEDEVYAHIVLRVLCFLVVGYVLKVVARGKVTIGELVFTLRRYWFKWMPKVLDLQAFSEGTFQEAA